MDVGGGEEQVRVRGVSGWDPQRREWGMWGGRQGRIREGEDEIAIYEVDEVQLEESGISLVRGDIV